MALFPSSEPSTSKPKEAAREKPPKPAKPPREKTAGEGYADAFVQAFRDRGRTVSRPTTNEITLLGKLCRDHALDRNGVALVGAALPIWIRAQTLAMLDDLENPEKHTGGVSVRGLGTWLSNRGGAVRVRELEPPRPPPKPEPERAPRLPPGCEDPEVADRMALDGAHLLSEPNRRDLIERVTARMKAREAAKAQSQETIA